MAIFGPKPWLNSFGKMSIFRLFKLFVFIAQKGVFLCQNIVKDIFLAYIAKKKKSIKWPFLDQNHGLIFPFGKMSIFTLFQLFLFIAQKGVFSCQNIVKDIFLAYVASKEKVEKWPFLDKNHGLTPLEKCQFFDFLNFLFLKRRKAFFCSRLS